MLKRQVTVDIELSTLDKAELFCQMNSHDMADFFSRVAKILEKWERPFCMQLAYVMQSEFLTPEGRRIMQELGEYGLDEELEELRRWKADMLQVESTWDVQAVGRMIDCQLGTDIRPAIAPAIVQLRKYRVALAWALSGEDDWHRQPEHVKEYYLRKADERCKNL